MLVRLRNRKKRKILFLLCIVSGMTLSIHTGIGVTTDHAVFQADADFFLEISTPTSMEYWETINLTITIDDLSGSTQNNISIKLILESGLFLAEGESDTHDIGNLGPFEEKHTNFSVTASKEFLTNPIVLYKTFLLKDGNEQVVRTKIEGEVYLLGYGIGSLSIKYPILAVTSVPLELVGFVVPRLSLTHNEIQTLTYNISNKGFSALKNLTFEVEVDKGVVEIVSTTLRGEIDGNLIENISFPSSSFPSLDTLPGDSFILFEIKIRCVSLIATDDSRVYLYFSSGFFSTREYSVQIQTYDIYNQYQYDNSLVFIVWPIYILFFAALALGISFYSWKKHIRRVKKARELIERYGASIVE